MRTAIGLFGGTFNPVHRGHIEPVLDVVSALGLAGVHFVPVNVPSHREAPGVSAQHRLDMLRLALARRDETGLLADDREIRRGGASYTIDTLEELRSLYGSEHSLVLILGLDAFLYLSSWHRWEELLDFAHIAVMERPGSELPATLPSWWSDALTSNSSDIAAAPAGKIIHIDVNELAISSTEVRQSLTRNELRADWLDEDVVGFIETHQLYGATAPLKMLPAQSSDSAKRKPESLSTSPGVTNPTPPTSDQDTETMSTASTAQSTDMPAAPKLASEIDSDQISRLVVEAMDDAKARDITSLDVRDMTDFTDYMIIATGTSDRHLRAVADNVRTELKTAGIKALGTEGDDAGEWVLIDLGGVIAHVMRKDAREFYDLDGLWSDDVRDLMQAQRDGSLGDEADS